MLLDDYPASAVAVEAVHEALVSEGAWRARGSQI